MYRDVVAKYGRVDVIYNNMGLMDRGDGSVLDTGLDTWRRVQDANLTSIFLACKHGIPRLRDTEPAGGSVINAASFLAATGAATAQMAYSAAKAAVVQLSRDLGVHVARSGVRGTPARRRHHRGVRRPGVTVRPVGRAVSAARIRLDELRSMPSAIARDGDGALSFLTTHGRSSR